MPDAKFIQIDDSYVRADEIVAVGLHGNRRARYDGYLECLCPDDFKMARQGGREVREVWLSRLFVTLRCGERQEFAERETNKVKADVARIASECGMARSDDAC